MEEPFDGKTLWDVTIEVQVVVLAKTREQAERIANDESYEITRKIDRSMIAGSPCEITITGKKRWAIPADWDDSEPYGKSNGKTCKEIVAEIDEYRRVHPTQAELEAAGQQVLSGCK